LKRQHDMGLGGDQMTENTSETCEMCGGRMRAECCQDCNHQMWTSDCTCDACIMAEEDDDEGGEMRWWIKLLPFFVVCWIARRSCSRHRIGDWVYVHPFGPGSKTKPEENVLVEVNVKNRHWYKEGEQ